MSTLCLQGSLSCYENIFIPLKLSQFKNPLLWQTHCCFNSLFLLFNEDSVIEWIKVVAFGA